MVGPTRTRTYTGTPEQQEAAYQADKVEAAQFGWVPRRREDALCVTYQQQQPDLAGAEPAARHGPVPEASTYFWGTPSAGENPVRTYTAGTPDLRWAAFQADRVAAAQYGWEPLGRELAGDMMRVTYHQPQRKTWSEPEPAAAHRPASSAAAPRSAAHRQPSAPLATPPATAGTITPGAAVIIGSGIAVAVGSFLPWVTVSSGIFSRSLNGTDAGSDGNLTFWIGVAILIGGLLQFSMYGAGGALIAGVAGVAAAVVAFLDYQDVARLAQDDSVQVSPGVGLFVVGIGGLLAVVAALLYLYRDWSEDAVDPKAPARGSATPLGAPLARSAPVRKPTEDNWRA